VGRIEPAGGDRDGNGVPGLSFQGFTQLNASGYVVAQRKAAVASKATGRLDWLGVEEGSRVRKGEVLARLESSDVAAARDQAAANLATAKAALEQSNAELDDASQSFSRQKELLLSQGIGGAVRIRRGAKHATNGQKPELPGRMRGEVGRRRPEGAEVSLEYTLIRAPFDAVVLTKNADVGTSSHPPWWPAAANAKAAGA